MVGDPLLKLANETGLRQGGSHVPPAPIYSLLLRIGPVILKTIFRISTRGTERLAKRGPVIIAGNHVSHIDPILMIVGARRTVRFLSKAEHFNNWFTRFVMITTGQLETRRETGGKEGIAQAVEVLEKGGMMGISLKGPVQRRKIHLTSNEARPALLVSLQPFPMFLFIQLHYLVHVRCLLQARVSFCVNLLSQCLLANL